MLKLKDAISNLTGVLQKHIWCVMFYGVLLLFWFAAFAYTGKGNNIASWLSIGLALIVVVYMFLQGFQSQANLTEMNNLISDVPRIVKETADIIIQQADVMIKTADEFKESLQLFEPQQQREGPPVALEGQRFSLTISSVSNMTILAMYIIVKASHASQSANIWKLAHHIPRKAQSERVKRYLPEGLFAFIIGVSYSFQSFFCAGTIKHETSSGLSINNLPDGFEQLVFNEMESRRQAGTWEQNHREIRGLIDVYFEQMQPHNSTLER